MSAEKVRDYLDERGLSDRITVHKETIDTVEHAAQQIGCSEAEIAKTLSFIVDEKPVIVVMAGDTRVNSSKFKKQFHTKPHMIPRDDVERITGDKPGGVCPFAMPEGIPIWLDISLKRFRYVYPAGGDAFTSVKITPEELEIVSRSVGWCDVCKGWEMQADPAKTEEPPQAPPELTDRQIYDTPIGSVCMSKTEHEAYLEEVELQKLRREKM